MTYHSIVWLPVCAGLTVLGLVLSYFAGRRRGRLSMLRGAAWSLLPLAIYLTGSVEMFWRIGEAIAHYVDVFAFSALKWAGIGVVALSAVLFAVSGGRGRRRAARLARAEGRRAAPGSGSAGPDAVTAPVPRQGTTKPLPVRKAGKASKPADDDGLSDVEAILRKRGL